MRNVFFTSDTHFGHEAVIRHSSRPFADVKEMNEELIRRWNVVVGKKDEVWHLGDFAWKHPGAFLPRLNGSVHLVLGNHDKVDRRLREAGFASIHDVHYLRLDGLRVFMSHYAHRTWRNSPHGAWHLFGHWHGRGDDLGLSTDVGVDAWSYAPVSLDELAERFADRQPHNHLSEL